MSLLQRAWFYRAIQARRRVTDKLFHPFSESKSRVGRLMGIVMLIASFQVIHAVRGICFLADAVCVVLIAPLDAIRLVIYWMQDERKIPVTGERRR